MRQRSNDCADGHILYELELGRIDDNLSRSELRVMKMSAENENIVSEMIQMFERLDEEEDEKAAAKCSSCGLPVESESSYCPACGHQLRKPERPKVIVRRITMT
jgi:rubrerythrin